MVTCSPPSLRTGGAEKFCWNLSSRLSRKGLDVGVLTSCTSAEEIVGSRTTAGVEVSDTLSKVESKIMRKLFFDYVNLRNARAVKDRIATFGPDVVHFHNIYGIGSNLIRESTLKVPTVITVHDSWPFCFRSTMVRNGIPCDLRCWRCRFPLAALTRTLKAFQVSRASLVAPSKFMASTLSKAGLFCAKTIHNAVDLHLKNPPAHYARRLLFLGRIVEDKGVRLACEAAESSGVRIVVMGEGRILTDLKRKYSGSLLVSFEGFKRDVDNEYEKGGIVILPSLLPENLPMVPLEAMSHGLPVIASRIGGIPEVVHDGYNGILFEPGNIDEIVSSIGRVIEPENYYRLSSNCISTILSEFSWERTLGEYEELYQEIVRN